MQCYRYSSQEPSYCTQVLSVGNDCKPAFAFGSSQLLWYSEPYKKISSRRESCVCAPALYLCACRGTVMVTRASRSTPFLRNRQEKKGSAKFTSLKHKNKIKVSSKLLICSDEEKLGARNSPAVMLWRSTALTHPSADGSPTSWPTPEATNGPGFKALHGELSKPCY